MNLARKVKDPDAILDYGFDWSLWLDTDTISTSTWIIPAGLTRDSQTNTTTTTTVWISSGVDGTEYPITNLITTAAGRQEDRTMTIIMDER